MKTLNTSSIDYTSDEYDQFYKQLYELIDTDKAAWDIPNGISVWEVGGDKNLTVIGFTALIATGADETHALLKKWCKYLKSKTGK